MYYHGIKFLQKLFSRNLQILKREVYFQELQKK